MKRLLFLLFFVPRALYAAEPMNLQQAVAAALEHNANVRNAQLEIAKSEANVRAQKTHRLPSFNLDALGSEALNRLSFEFREGAFGTFPSTGPIPNKDTRIELARTFNTFAIARVTQPITQLHKINLGVRLGEAALAVDKEQQRAARQAIAREVKSAFFQVVTAREYDKAAKEAVGVYEEVEREMNVRVSQQAVLEADRLDAVARLAAARATAATAANALASAQDQLNYLVGQEIEVVPIVPGNWEPATGNIDNRPDIRKATLQVDAARLDARLKSADRIPDVSLTVARTTPIHFDVLPDNLTTASVVVSWEPFTWGRRSAEIAQKRLTVEQAENALADRRAAAAVEIAALHRKLEDAFAQINVRHLELEATRERLRVTKAKFEQHAARPDEMFAASSAITQAAARQQEAASAYWTARADYEKAIGEE